MAKEAALETLDIPRTLGAPSLKSGEGAKVEKAVTVSCSPIQAYAFWRKFENWPSFMEHIVMVGSLTETQSHWVAQTPKGDKVAWDAQIIEDKRGELISWQSLPGGDLDSAGSVRFAPAPGNRGTVVKIALKYAPAGSKVARLFAKYFTKAANKEISQNLFHFKSLIETGEIPTVEGQPKGP